MLLILPLNTLSGIGVEADVRVVAEADEGKVVLVYVAHDPDVVEVGDGEKVRRVVERLHAGAGCHVLLDDDARYGGVDIDDPVRVVFEVRNAEYP